MGKLNSNPSLSLKNSVLSSLLYIPITITYTLSKKVEELCKNIIPNYSNYTPVFSVDEWYKYTCLHNMSDKEKQQLEELYQNYKDSEIIIKEIQWYINRLFNVDAPLYVQKHCIPEYYWKYLVSFIDYNSTSFSDVYPYDSDWIKNRFFNQETYDLMEQQPLKAVLLGVEI